MKSWRARMDRRNFLLRGGSTLAVGSLWVACAPESEEESAMPAEQVQTETPAEDFGPFDMGFQSYSLRHFQSMDEFIPQAQNLGLHFVELYRGHLPVTASEQEIEQVKDRLASIDLEVNAFGVERFTADHEQNEAIFKFGQMLGVRNLSANPTKDAFDSLEKLVDQYDIRIAIHNHGPEDETWRKPEWILEAIQNRDSRIGACVDTGHFIRADVDPVEAIRMLDDRVLGVHLKDFDADKKETLVGQGLLDLAGTLDALKEVGFDGVMSLEYEDHSEDPVPHMKQELEEVKKVLGQKATA